MIEGRRDVGAGRESLSDGNTPDEITNYSSQAMQEKSKVTTLDSVSR